MIPKDALRNYRIMKTIDSAIESVDESPLVAWRKERRIGRFIIPDMWMIVRPQTVFNIMTSVIVVRAESRYDVDGIDYIALGEHFDPVPNCEIAPNYLFKFSLDESRNETFSWIKQ